MSIDYDLFVINPENKDTTFEQFRDCVYDALSELNKRVLGGGALELWFVYYEDHDGITAYGHYRAADMKDAIALFVKEHDADIRDCGTGEIRSHLIQAERIY